VFHRSFRRPVKIRVETEPPLSADRVVPLLPAGTLLPTTRRLALVLRPRAPLIRFEQAPQPDWRIVGDHELMLQEESEAV
jgi:hypothetical protein